MKRALAVSRPGSSVRRVLFQEFVEGRQRRPNKRDRAPFGIFAIEEEGSVSSLAVSRRPDAPGAGQCARLALDEQPRAEIAFAALKRGIPAIALKIGRRMDVEDRGRHGSMRERLPRQPFGRDRRKVGPGDPVRGSV